MRGDFPPSVESGLAGFDESGNPDRFAGFFGMFDISPPQHLTIHPAIAPRTTHGSVADHRGIREVSSSK